MNTKEILHYIVVFAVIAGTWQFYMGLAQNNLPITLGLSFATFVLADQMAHKFFKL